MIPLQILKTYILPKSWTDIAQHFTLCHDRWDEYAYEADGDGNWLDGAGNSGSGMLKNSGQYFF